MLLISSGLTDHDGLLVIKGLENSIELNSKLLLVPLLRRKEKRRRP